jgi:hypothetical protein
MSAQTRIEEVIRRFYYEHHDSNQFRTDLLAVVEAEKHDFLTKLISHVDTRLHDMALAEISSATADYELRGMRSYLKRQRGDKDEPPPSVL